MTKVQKWLDNFWYHYKWHTIITVFLVIFLSICIGQMIDKENVDVYIMYAGPAYFEADQVTQIENTFSEIIPDLNGDGKKKVQFFYKVILNDEQIEENKKRFEAEGKEYRPDLEFIAKQKQEFKLQLAVGDAYIVLLDPSLYLEDRDLGVFEKLDTLGIKSDHANDHSSIVFRNTDYGRYYELFELFPEDTLLCYRALNITGKTKGAKEQKKYANQLVLMKSIVDFEADLPDNKEE